MSRRFTSERRRGKRWSSGSLPQRFLFDREKCLPVPAGEVAAVDRLDTTGPPNNGLRVGLIPACAVTPELTFACRR